MKKVVVTYATSEGSGEPAHVCSLARAFAVSSHKGKLQTKNHISGLKDLKRHKAKVPHEMAQVDPATVVLVKEYVDSPPWLSGLGR